MNDKTILTTEFIIETRERKPFSLLDQLRSTLGARGFFLVEDDRIYVFFNDSFVKSSVISLYVATDV